MHYLKPQCVEMFNFWRVASLKVAVSACYLRVQMYLCRLGLHVGAL